MARPTRAPRPPRAPAPPPAARTAQSRAHQTEERRAQLLALGKRIFSAHPYDVVSTELIAEEAGVSVGLLYHYFGNKKGYYVATIRAAADEVLAATRFPPGRPFGESALVALAGFLDFVEANSLLYQGLMRGGVGADPEVHTILEEVRTTVINRLGDAAGVSPGPALRLRVYAWLGLCEAATLRWLQHREVTRDELLHLLVTSLPLLAEV